MDSFKPRGSWIYHLTTRKSLPCIVREGLVPCLNRSRFGPMSIEAQDGKAKIFLLPICGGSGMKGFLAEWWHGPVSDAMLLRMPHDGLLLWQSSDAYNARHEIWTYRAISSERIEWTELGQRYSWRPLVSVQT